jgi:hypothetical protein
MSKATAAPGTFAAQDMAHLLNKMGRLEETDAM